MREVSLNQNSDWPLTTTTMKIPLADLAAWMASAIPPVNHSIVDAKVLLKTQLFISLKRFKQLLKQKIVDYLWLDFILKYLAVFLQSWRNSSNLGSF